MDSKPLLLVIVGPTAAGKSAAALYVAKQIAAEIVSADSMQVYKFMDIGTAKPSAAERRAVPHHLIDIIYPDETFSAAEYKQAAQSAIDEILNRGHQPVLVGGTGLYVKSVIDNYFFPEAKVDYELRKQLRCLATERGNTFLFDRLKELDPVSAERINVNDTKRIIRALEVYELTKQPISLFEKLTRQREPLYRLKIFGLSMDREKLYDRINKRTELMIKNGLIDEVKNLLDMGYSKDLNSMRGLGYKQIVEYLRGEVGLSDAIENIKRETRRYAKRQLTWFRKDKRIHWIDVDVIEEQPGEYILGKLTQ